MSLTAQLISIVFSSDLNRLWPRLRKFLLHTTKKKNGESDSIRILNF
jgi:hypothetical protein